MPKKKKKPEFQNPQDQKERKKPIKPDDTLIPPTEPEETKTLEEDDINNDSLESMILQFIQENRLSESFQEKESKLLIIKGAIEAVEKQLQALEDKKDPAILKKLGQKSLGRLEKSKNKTLISKLNLFLDKLRNLEEKLEDPAIKELGKENKKAKIEAVREKARKTSYQKKYSDRNKESIRKIFTKFKEGELKEELSEALEVIISFEGDSEKSKAENIADRYAMARNFLRGYDPFLNARTAVHPAYAAEYMQVFLEEADKIKTARDS